MTWNNPKKDWKAGDTPNSGDFNRIEENIDILGRLDRTSAYGVAIGTNSYAVTLDPAPLAYYEGMCIAVKITSQNTGSSTINVNGLGAKSIRKQNGNLVSAGNLKAGIIYTMRYNGTNFILQGEGGEGTAQVGDVIVGKTFTNDSGTFTGTLKRHASGTLILPLSRVLTRPDRPDWGHIYVTHAINVNIGFKPSKINVVGYIPSDDGNYFDTQLYDIYNPYGVVGGSYVVIDKVDVGGNGYTEIVATATGFKIDNNDRGYYFNDFSHYNGKSLTMYYTAIE